MQVLPRLPDSRYVALTMPAYRLLLLDFDGTLADTRPAIVHAMQRTFEELGAQPPSADAIHATIGLPLVLGIPQLNPGLPPQAVPAWVERYRAIYCEHAGPRTRLFAGVAETLRSLASVGIELVVVSNKGQVPLTLALADLGLAGFVALAVGDRPGVPAKPDLLFFEAGVRPHFQGVAASEILMVGDTEIDLTFARNIGAHACFAAYGYGRAEACLALEPRHTIRTVGELCRIFGLG